MDAVLQNCIDAKISLAMKENVTGSYACLSATVLPYTYVHTNFWLSVPHSSFLQFEKTKCLCQLNFQNVNFTDDNLTIKIMSLKTLCIQ